MLCSAIAGVTRAVRFDARRRVLANAHDLGKLVRIPLKPPASTRLLDANGFFKVQHAERVFDTPSYVNLNQQNSGFSFPTGPARERTEWHTVYSCSKLRGLDSGLESTLGPSELPRRRLDPDTVPPRVYYVSSTEEAKTVYDDLRLSPGEVLMPLGRTRVAVWPVNEVYALEWRKDKHSPKILIAATTYRALEYALPLLTWRETVALSVLGFGEGFGEFALFCPWDNILIWLIHCLP
mmetsp:Transcript_19440/g.62386  ORF Transcript_19440/g.62386 Transcript_19440/m.62386 type:complete len:237 (+) Transcript_19440:104-814(+)